MCHLTGIIATLASLFVHKKAIVLWAVGTCVLKAKQENGKHSVIGHSSQFWFSSDFAVYQVLLHYVFDHSEYTN